MSFDLTRKATPEEAELETKKAQVSTLEGELAQRELELATFRAELGIFESRYLHIVGILIAELDEIEAQIAEAKVRLYPRESKRQEEASRARTRAEESAQEAKSAKKPRSVPSEDLKKLYREVAFKVHPDLATDQEDRFAREKFMAEANLAYEEGDKSKLQAILNEWLSRPESVKGEGIGAELVRAIRKIDQVKARISAIEKEVAQLKDYEYCKLKSMWEEAEREGRDFLEEMASQVRERISEAKQRLADVTAEASSNE